MLGSVGRVGKPAPGCGRAWRRSLASPITNNCSGHKLGLRLSTRGFLFCIQLHGIGEVREEIVGDLLCRAVDQSLAELRQLAANLGIDIVGQKRPAIFRRELHRGAALGEAGNPAVALPGNLVTVGRIEI
jgi:hypothetical protein